MSPLTAASRRWLAIAGLLLAACSSGSPAPERASGSTTSTTAATSSVQRVDIGGYELAIECEGEGSPTVVFEAGAGGDRSAFAKQLDDLRETSRVCAYDRAGIGASDDRPAAGPTTLSHLADELARVLQGAGIDEPIVLASHSLGGGVAQFFAGRYADRVAGLVFVDSIAIPEFTVRFGPEIDDGTGGSIDMQKTSEEWEQLGTFGAIPTIVLTQNFTGEDDQAPEEFRGYFRQVHADLAARSSSALHVIAVDSGHFIQTTSPDLVTAAITEVVEAVRSGDALAPCDARFEDLGGVCA
jgi:hypothetical protein